MSEYKPFFHKIEEEIDAFFGLWKRRRGLALLGIIALIIIGSYLCISLLISKTEIKSLSAEVISLRQENNTLRIENKSLREIVAPLLKQAAEKFPGEEISVSLKKLLPLLQKNDPYEQLIRTATATIHITIESNEQLNNTFMDQGGYVAFGKGSEALIIMADTKCTALQNGKGQVIYQGVFNMDASHPASSHPLSYLRATEYLQIEFKPLPARSKVVSGKVVCIFNSQERIEMEIPSQQMTDEKIYVRDMGKIF